jgi:predicted dehydrogenase
MVHDLYILHDLFGPAARVSATGASFLTPGVADAASAQVIFACGLHAVCYASWYEPIKTRRMTLVGSRAMAEYDDLRVRGPVRVLECGYEPIEGVDAFGNEGLRHFNRGERVVPVMWEEPLRREIETFVARVRGDQRLPGVSPASVLEVTRTLVAIGRSMRRDGASERVEGG